MPDYEIQELIYAIACRLNAELFLTTQEEEKARGVMRALQSILHERRKFAKSVRRRRSSKGSGLADFP